MLSDNGAHRRGVMEAMRQVVKQAKTARLAVRVQPALYKSIAEAAERSGWDVSDQVRFELMQLRGMTNGPQLPAHEPHKKKVS